MSGNLKATTKRSGVEQVLAGIEPPVVLSDELVAAFNQGVAHESQAYVQRKYNQLKLFIEVARNWWNLPDGERTKFLHDPWGFKAFVGQVKVFANQAAQSMLLHIVHPDDFEPIMSAKHKELIAERLAVGAESTIEDLDRRLHAIRERMTPERTAGFSFYEPDLKPLWLPETAVEVVEKVTPPPSDVEVEAVKLVEVVPDYDKLRNLSDAGGTLTPAETRLATLLFKRLNVLLYGPPGTGKTHAALRVADAWKRWQGANAVEQVTFHPSYAYEDFIEGFRPDVSGKFTRRSGIFVRLSQRARENPSRDFLLVIDEINRGDVARILGELITLIERDKRNASASRLLPYSQDEFWVPPNLHLLGTMNTADRSISLLDIAIRRRFAFIEYIPDGQVIAAASGHYQTVAGVDLVRLMTALNARLQKIGVERDRAIGHAHFLMKRKGEGDGLDDLRERLRHDVLPLVEEYCYADRSQMQTVLGELVADGIADEAVLGSDSRLVEVLSKLCDMPA
jgi:5-methylcytosine-specific restriction protein B